MALVPGDFNISIILDDNRLVIGHDKRLTFLFSNNSETDTIYNVGFTLNLPDGMSFVSSSAIPSTNIINENNNNIVTFTNVKDLYPQELNYEVTVDIKIDENFRSTNVPVPYNFSFSDISISASGDSKPRGNFDEGNTTVSSKSTTTVTSVRYMFNMVYSSSQLKGAGTSSETLDATSTFPITLQIINSTRDSSDVSLKISLANGIRYLGSWATSGTDSANFSNPEIYPVTSSQDHVNILLENKTLSPGSDTSVTFQAAIWDKYTENGVENSGELIQNGTSLLSSASLSGNNTSYSSNFDITALELKLVQTVENAITDVALLNEYTLSYSTSSYFSQKDVLFYFIIPDGMSYIEDSSTVNPTSISMVDNTTVLRWNMESLNGNVDDFIKLYTITDPSYMSGEDVYSTDTFTSFFNADYIPDESEEIYTYKTSQLLIAAPPIINTHVLGYYSNDFVKKDIDVATVGDYIHLEIVYDASSINAQQKDVILYDYPPLNIDTTGVQNIETSGDVPDGLSYFTAPNNGAMIPAGTLQGGTQFSISFYLPVVSESSDSNIYNLAKAVLKNTQEISYSTRDSATIFYGQPYLQIKSSFTQKECIKLNDTFTYNIKIQNTDNNPDTHVSDGFNIDFNSVIPSIYSIISKPIINTNSDITELLINDNNLSLTINKIPPEGFLNLSMDLQVNDTPIMKQNYVTRSSITNGTSQEDLNSYRYDSNRYPLSNNTARSGCGPTIEKTFTPSTVTFNEEHRSTIVVTYPQGVLGYNNKIKDSLVTSTDENLRNLTLNGSSASYASVTNNITVPIADKIDTTDGAVKFVIEYDNTIEPLEIPNYGVTIPTPVSIEWAVQELAPETLFESTSASLNIVIPGINTLLYQSNETKTIDYDIYPIYGEKGDSIIYRAVMTNVGKSTAYDVSFENTIPNNMTYISNNVDATYNESTRKLTANIPNIESGESAEILFTTTINNDSPYLIAENSVTSYYSENNDSDVYTSTSNTTTLYNTEKLIQFEKLQRNLTSGNQFTKSYIKSYPDQSIQYKVYVYNTQNTTLRNIRISDSFPDNFSFVSYNEFDKGEISVRDNLVDISIPSLAPLETAEIIYTVKLTEDTLQTLFSNSLISYSFKDSPNRMSLRSNTVYIKVAGLGKGFLSY